MSLGQLMISIGGAAARPGWPGADSGVVGPLRPHQLWLCWFIFALEKLLMMA